jgi:hypothetical protein
VTGVSASSAVTGCVIVDTQPGSGPAGNGTPNHIGVQGMTASNGLTRQQDDELADLMARVLPLVGWLRSFEEAAREERAPQQVAIEARDLLALWDLLHRVHRLRVGSQREVARLSRILTDEAPRGRRRAS